MLDKDLIELKKKLFFDELEELSKISDNEEYNKKKQEIFNKLIKKNKQNKKLDLEKIIEEIKLINPEDIDGDIKQNNISFFSLI